MYDEALQQHDLLVGEGPHFGAVDDDRSEQSVLFSERNGEPSTNAPRVYPLSVIRIGPVGFSLQHIGDMEDALAPHERLEQATGPRSDRAKLPYALRYACLAVHRDGIKDFAVISTEHPECRAAQLHCLVEHRVEHRAEVAG